MAVDDAHAHRQSDDRAAAAAPLHAGQPADAGGGSASASPLALAGRGRLFALLGLFAVGAVVVLLAPQWLAPIRASVGEAVDWLRPASISGVLSFLLVYIVAIAVFLPVTLAAMLAGFVWGAAGGTAIIMAGNVVGTTAAFVLGRWLFRGAVEQWVAGRPRLRALRTALDLGGGRAVILLRFSPIVPMAALNYGLSVTGLSLATYTWSTLVGLLPMAWLYCALGAGLQRLDALVRGDVQPGAGGQVLFWLGVVGTGVLVVWLGRLAQRTLDAAAIGPDGSDGAPNEALSPPRV